MPYGLPYPIEFKVVSGTLEVWHDLVQRIAEGTSPFRKKQQQQQQLSIVDTN